MEWDTTQSYPLCSHWLTYHHLHTKHNNYVKLHPEYFLSWTYFHYLHYSFISHLIFMAIVSPITFILVRKLPLMYPCCTLQDLSKKHLFSRPVSLHLTFRQGLLLKQLKTSMFVRLYFFLGTLRFGVHLIYHGFSPLGNVCSLSIGMVTYN